ncbi:MAG TPA: hypothetical protein VK148_30800 [Xanthobacteraceae bacterium]|jgi:hypothetical protein|nr:hypothetical protein [Xanthobacteraceae bacterium]
MIKFARIAAGLFGVILILLAVGAAVNHNFNLVALLKMRAVDLFVFGVIILWITAFGHNPSERLRIWSTVQIGLNFWIIGMVVRYCGPLIFGAGFYLGPINGSAIASVMGTIGLVTGILWTSLRRGGQTAAAA